MNIKIYADIGYTVVWCIKYIFIPITVAVLARIIADRILRPQPERQRKNGLKKPLLKIIH